MAQDTMVRRLSTILAADVVGYSRLMEVDEAGTLTALNARRRDLINPAVARHDGRIVKTMGDGFLIEFVSVVEAVQCAIDLQDGMETANADLTDDRKMRLRIGINLGDVIVEADDLYGDGVNIAARLQALAESGWVLISGTVYDHLKNKVAAGFEFLGEKHVKNIAQAVRVYRVLPGAKDAGSRKHRPRARLLLRAGAGLALSAVAIVAALVIWPDVWKPTTTDSSLPLPEKLSIAVLPFTNMSGDPEQSYFADGITDDLITDLSQVSDLFVISRNSTFAYKGRSVDPRQVAKELGVRYVLEGSVQRAGDKIRINAQLIDASSGGHVWADRYDGSLSDVFSLQDDVTRSITNALSLRLTDEDKQILGRRETTVPAAYDAFLRGWEHFLLGTSEDYIKAIPHFEQAIQLDPNYGRAYAALALDYHWKATTAWNRGVSDFFSTEVTSAIDRNLAEAKKHPTSTSHQVAGLMAFGYGFSGDAIAEFSEAIALDPSDSWSYAYMARSLAFVGKPKEALQYIRTAMRLDPHHPPVFLAFLGLAQFGMEDYEGASVSLREATRLNPDDAAGLLLLGAAEAYLGHKAEAMSAVAAYDAIGRRYGRPPVTATWAWGTWSYYEREDQDRLFKGLLLAGVPERVPKSE
ncbi:MAG TPA: adenylate/guanylate cyclase domain-containing protein [Dongiaceae bacterium]|nr:adenylate/guanylate cyclase domain-containing protein [Dongiaceae bacterium]